MDSELAPLLLSGVNLMLIGMGIVFSFLLLLVWIIQRTHRLLLRWEPRDAVPGEDAATLPDNSSVDNQAVVAAIVAAINQHENRSNGGTELDA